MLHKYYQWKVLSEDGLLKDHKEFGPYYNQKSFNSSYKTEEEAVNEYTKFIEENDFWVESEMVLIKVYSKYEKF